MLSCLVPLFRLGVNPEYHDAMGRNRSLISGAIQLHVLASPKIFRLLRSSLEAGI